VVPGVERQTWDRHRERGEEGATMAGKGNRMNATYTVDRTLPLPRQVERVAIP
jgi:hypothetical protein